MVFKNVRVIPKILSRLLRGHASQVENHFFSPSRFKKKISMNPKEKFPKVNKLYLENKKIQILFLNYNRFKKRIKQSAKQSFQWLNLRATCEHLINK